jgi:hypothetical protein
VNPTSGEGQAFPVSYKTPWLPIQKPIEHFFTPNMTSSLQTFDGRHYELVEVAN